MLLRVSLKSLMTRKLAVGFIIVALALSISTLLITRSISEQLQASFSSSVSGTDLIVGARAHPLQVVLYSVFRLGSPTQAISVERATNIATKPYVKWSFPIVLGDSHRGYAVMGTNNDYFQFFNYGRKQSLKASNGELQFQHPLQVIIGADVAKKLHYNVGDFLILSHGAHQHSFQHHDDAHFQISAILAPTGTPVDSTLHVHLATLEAMHTPTFNQLIKAIPELTIDPENTVTQSATKLAEPSLKAKSTSHHHAHHAHHPLHIPNSEGRPLPALDFAQLPEPTVISALFLGLTQRALVFRTQADLNAAHIEPLSAVIPGVALGELWGLLGNVEQLMTIISAIMLVSALLGSIAMLQLSLTLRQQEFALLRLIGAKPWQLAWLMQFDILIIMAASWLVALPLSAISLFAIQELIAWLSGIRLDAMLNLQNIGFYAASSFLLALLAGLIPAWFTYRLGLKPQAL